VSYSKLILKDYADIVWPLDDIGPNATFSSAINFLDTNPSALSASINTNATQVQEVPMIYGGGKLLQFTSSAVCLSVPAMGRFSELYKDKNSVITFWIKINQSSTQEQIIFKKRGEDNLGLFIQNNYLIFKFGTNDKVSRVVCPITELNEPHYISVSVGPGYQSIMIDGIEKTERIDNSVFPPYSNYSKDTDVIDFYGPSEGVWEIDSPALFPNAINFSTAKRHYVYGLGKWIDDGLFFSRGGNIYNFTTIETQKAAEISWDFPEQWKLYKFNDLQADDSGIGPILLDPPELQSFDNNIDKTDNSIKFFSNERTLTSYIDIANIYQKILDGSYPFFVKICLDGPLPVDGLEQRIISYGNLPDQEIFNIDLINDNDEYKIRLTSSEYTASASFNITGISSSPDIYVGFGFSSKSDFYFSQNGSAIQTASFSEIMIQEEDEEELGEEEIIIDPLSDFFPPDLDNRVRIGGSFLYDLRTSSPDQPIDFKQFCGTFKKFIVINPSHLEEIQTFEDLDSYKKMRYGFIYNSSENRFIVSTYGSGEFNIHPPDMAEIIDDDTFVIGANVIDVGYPDVTSASNVVFNVTQYSYSGSVIHGPDRLDKLTHLGYLNNTNLDGKYLNFSFEIYAEDTFVYPPKISYFHMDTYKNDNGSVTLKDDAGVPYKIYPSSSSTIYLPESRLTPNVFLKENSGIKIKENFVEFQENFYPIPLDPRDIPGLVLWLDSRNPLGLRRSTYNDDEKISRWLDLSDNGFDAVQNSIENQPVYRAQSINLFTVEQLSGINSGSQAVSASVVSSTINSFGSGIQSFELKPNNTSIDSYLPIENNSASITVFPNQSYTVVGTITLNKRQTASALSEYARSVVVYNTSGSVQTIAAASSPANNVAGSQSLSVTFSTDSTTTGAVVRYYNGSFSPDDTVYWSNLGLYSISSSVAFGSGGSASTDMPIFEWAFPLTEPNDHPVIKFNGINTFMETAASVSQPYTMFVVGRAFNDGVFVGYTASGASLYSYDGNYYISSGSAQPQTPSTNDYNIYTIQVNSGSARFFINGDPSSIKETGQNNIDGLIIGKGTLLDNSENYLLGDISSIVLYSGALTYQERSAVENWLDESYNLLSPVIGLTLENDKYLDEYTGRYPIS
jgi:hypothetical protein